MTDLALIERITRSLAFMLRHQPETFDLELDPHGYADLEDVVHALNERLGEPVEEEDVREAVASGDRPRYEIQGDRIRALYGHSIPVEPGPSSKPPEFLYVAVPESELERARRFGLRGGRRRFLHLAITPDDAAESGRRAARDYTVLVVHALDAWEEGISFYDRQALWLAEEVPTHLIEVEGTYHDGTEPLGRHHDGGGRERGRDRERDGHGGRSRGGRGRGRDRDRHGGRDRRDDARGSGRPYRDERPDERRREPVEARGGDFDRDRERGDRDRGDRDRGDRDRGERIDGGDRGERSDRGDRGERSDRGDRERSDRGDRGDRGGSDRGDRGDRGGSDRGGSDRGGSDRGDRERSDRGDRERGDRGDRERGDRDRGRGGHERPERFDRDRDRGRGREEQREPAPAFGAERGAEDRRGDRGFERRDDRDRRPRDERREPRGDERRGPPAREREPAREPRGASSGGGFGAGIESERTPARPAPPPPPPPRPSAPPPRERPPADEGPGFGAGI